MTGPDHPPVADDDFPEFAGPPRHRPDPSHAPRDREDEVDDQAQAQVDDVIARLRRERDEGRR